jgi:hypothetical protein
MQHCCEDRPVPSLPSLPMSSSSLLVRTDFTDSTDGRWEQVRDQALRENEDGFRAYAEPVSDPGFEHATWAAVRAAVPRHDEGASVLFVADATTLSSPDHPILVVDLLDEGLTPFRCVPSALWSVDNNLNIANLDWADFADAVDKDGVFRGFRE